MSHVLVLVVEFGDKGMLENLPSIGPACPVNREHLLEQIFEVFILQQAKVVLLLQVKVDILEHPLLQLYGLLHVPVHILPFVVPKHRRLQYGLLLLIFYHAFYRQLKLQRHAGRHLAKDRPQGEDVNRAGRLDEVREHVVQPEFAVLRMTKVVVRLPVLQDPKHFGRQVVDQIRHLKAGGVLQQGRVPEVQELHIIYIMRAAFQNNVLGPQLCED